jgi:hypothetical protein
MKSSETYQMLQATYMQYIKCGPAGVNPTFQKWEIAEYLKNY